MCYSEIPILNLETLSSDIPRFNTIELSTHIPPEPLPRIVERKLERTKIDAGYRQINAGLQQMHDLADDARKNLQLYSSLDDKIYAIDLGPAYEHSDLKLTIEKTENMIYYELSVSSVTVTGYLAEGRFTCDVPKVKDGQLQEVSSNALEVKPFVDSKEHESVFYMVLNGLLEIMDQPSKYEHNKGEIGKAYTVTFEPSRKKPQKLEPKKDYYFGFFCGPVCTPAETKEANKK